MREHDDNLIGESPAFLTILDQVSRAAPLDRPVLVIGERGTGKELIAARLHFLSGRWEHPFVKLNCAALPPTLLETELFGHEAGAFTGAARQRKGRFERADDGTLFLDELASTPPEVQEKILRVIEYSEFERVGGQQPIRVDVRLIAATNVDLQKKVEERTFREDLYYRLNQWVIRVPPLRERRDDIPLLAIHLLQRANRTHGVECPGFSSEALEQMMKYLWPGNVRELANVIESLAVEVEDRQIEHEDLPDRIRGPRDLVPVTPGMVGLTMAQVERMMIERTLQATGGNREQAAKMLDIGTRTLYRKLKEYGLS